MCVIALCQLIVMVIALFQGKQNANLDNSLSMYIGNMICYYIVECNVKWYNKLEKRVYRLEDMCYDTN